MSRNSFLLGAGVVAAVLLGSAVYFVGGITHIKVGSVGIIKHMDGQVTEIPQGWHWTGWGVGVEELPTYTQSLVLSNSNKEGGKDNGQWKVGTADQQELPVNTSLTWKIDTKNAPALYQSVGGKDMDYVRDSIVSPTMKNIVNEVTHQYGWNSIKGDKQVEVTNKINARLDAELNKQGIDIGVFGFTYVGSPDGMAQSQQALASAELGKQKAQADLEKQRIENQVTIEKAQADAKAKEIETQATKAQAQTLNEFVIQKLWIEKWDGRQSQYQLGNSTPLVNIPSGK